MSTFEAIIASIVLIVAAILLTVMINTSATKTEADTPKVDIVWQSQLVHNAINNPYIDLQPTSSDSMTNSDNESSDDAEFSEEDSSDGNFSEDNSSDENFSGDNSNDDEKISSNDSSYSEIENTSDQFNSDSEVFSDSNIEE